MARKESGYAWFIVFCSFALHFITDGVSYTFGIFFSELLDEFKSTKASSAWVPSIMTGITYGVGPVASALTNKYGCRTIAITGTTLVATGFFLSTFARSVSILYFTIGVLAGAGFGLIYLPAIVIITQYFSTRLALATGLAVSAAGVGSALFAPVTEIMIQQLGWRSAMQMISAILFISGLFGLSFKNFEYGDVSTESGEEEDTTEDGFDEEITKQKIVKFNQNEDYLCRDEKKLMENNLDKLCNENALLTKNKIQLSQNSLNSVTSNEKHNRIINSHLNKQHFNNSELDERNEQDNEMLIPNTDNKNYDNDDKYNKLDNNKFNDNLDVNEQQFKNNSNINLEPVSNLQTNLGTSLNTNLNNLNNNINNLNNNVSRTTNEIPRLSLDSSANYRLHHQLQKHHLKIKEEELKQNALNVNNLHNNLVNIDLNTDQNLIKSHNDLPNHSQLSPNQIQQYKSFNSLHQQNLNLNNLPIATAQLKMNSSNCTNLNTIVLYSTSMTSINYCCSNEPSKETSSSKKNSISSQKLSNVLTTSLQNENLKSKSLDKKSNRLIMNKHPDKLTYSKKKRGSTVQKIMTVGKYLSVLLSWNLLRDQIFLWFAISNFLTSLGYYVPYIYIKERCLIIPDLSDKKDCSYLLSIIGFSSTVGRILFGFLSDFQRCNRIYIYAHCLTLCGLSTMLTIFAINYSFLAVYCVIFGLTSGAFVSLTTVLIVDLMGPDYVSNAFGLLLLFQGVASLSGPPIVGLLFDYTSSYDPGFLLIGVFIVISGAMLYFIKCCKTKA